MCAALAGCAAEMEGEDDVGTNRMTFEEFEAQAYREPDTGVYIVNGDTPIEDREGLLRFYQENFQDGALIVHRAGGVDAAWTPAQKLAITYCVSTAFGSNFGAVRDAMAAAARRWERSAFVDFIYVPGQNASCTATNNSVVFDVRPVSGQPFLARAFFPNFARANRNVLIDSAIFGNIAPFTLTGVLTHELGHALGFRHEHTRPEAGTCFEDNDWRALTPYDAASVMHYPQCNGTNSGDLQLTSRDRSGAALLYGAATVRRIEADFNGDGDTDLLIVTPSGSYVYLSLGNGQFQANVYVRNDLPLGKVHYTPGDFNGDGNTDLIITTAGGSFEYLSLGNGQFQANVYVRNDLPLGAAEFTPGDFNGDGNTDLIITTASGSYEYLSLGNGQFQANVYVRNDLPLETVAYTPIDSNADGNTDLMITTASGSYEYLSLGNGQFQANVYVRNDLPIGAVGYKPADFDGDGDTDLMITTAGGSYEYRSLGNGQFQGNVYVRPDLPIGTVQYH